MKNIGFIFLLAFLLVNCGKIDSHTNHVFYLHGRIIELQGIDAVSEQFGRYEYDQMIDSIKVTGAVLHNEIRTKQTDFQEFCNKVSEQINALIKQGVSPNRITVIGASKGGVMAMSISHINEHPIKYVLLAANNDDIERENEWNLHGRILAFYEVTDSLASKDYQHWIDVSTDAVEFNQIALKTGLGHGFIYQPLSVWWQPTKKFIGQ